ncbi:MAG: NusG domain II-containing protein [Thermodesulfobacteriota bacterium]|jgi:hypothetical protein
MLTLPDKILIGGLVIVTLLSFPTIRHFHHEGKRVVIELDGDVVGNFPLKDDRLLPVEGKLGKTWVKMAEGRVRIVDSPCPYKLCVKSGSIRMSGENLICLPNKVVVRIAGDDGEAVDAVSR